MTNLSLDVKAAVEAAQEEVAPNSPKVGDYIAFKAKRVSLSEDEAEKEIPVPAVHTDEWIAFREADGDKWAVVNRGRSMRKVAPFLVRRGVEKGVSFAEGSVYIVKYLGDKDLGNGKAYKQAIVIENDDWPQSWMPEWIGRLKEPRRPKVTEEKATEKKSIADKLVELGQAMVSEAFTDENGTPFVSVKDGKGGVRAVLTDSEEFRLMLTDAYFKECGKSPNKEALYQATNLFEALSIGGKRLDLAVRFTFRDGKVLYDLNNEENEIVVVTRDGWTIARQGEPIFRRYSHMKAQVRPLVGGNLTLIFNHVKVVKDEDALFLGSLASTLFGETPRTIEVVAGGKGKVKSTRQKMEKALLDPDSLLTVFMPRRQEDLCKILMENAVVVFDNVWNISREASDTLCRATTGDGVSQRELYTNEGTVIWVYKRKIMINGTRNPLTATDAIDRENTFEARKPETRREEDEVWADFYADLPNILGGLFDAVAGALRNRTDVKAELTGRLPRMADYTVNAEAAVRSIAGYKPLDFLNQYLENRKDANEQVLEESLVAKAIRHQIGLMLIAKNGSVEKEAGEEKPVVWDVTVKELRKVLETAADTIGLPWRSAKDEEHPRWPRTDKAMSEFLNEVESNLEDVGIHVTRVKHTERGNLVRFETGRLHEHDDGFAKPRLKHVSTAERPERISSTPRGGSNKKNERGERVPDKIGKRLQDVQPLVERSADDPPHVGDLPDDDRPLNVRIASAKAGKAAHGVSKEDADRPAWCTCKGHVHKPRENNIYCFANAGTCFCEAPSSKESWEAARAR